MAGLPRIVVPRHDTNGVLNRDVLAAGWHCARAELAERTPETNELLMSDTKEVPGVVKVSEGAAKSLPNPAQVGDVNIAPTTTAAGDLVTAGQRKINLIWETTQAIIAVLVTAATLWVSAQLALRDSPETAAFLLLSNAFFLVVTAYVVRTNHSKTGGVAEEQRRGE